MTRRRSNGGLLSDELEPWWPIAIVPQGVWVEMTGPSGYNSWPNFLSIGRLEGTGIFVSEQQDNFEDRGWHPTHWRPITPLPPKQGVRSVE